MERNRLEEVACKCSVVTQSDLWPHPGMLNNDTICVYSNFSHNKDMSGFSSIFCCSFLYYENSFLCADKSDIIFTAFHVKIQENDIDKCPPKFCHKCYKLASRERQLPQYQSCIPNTVTAPIQNETPMQGAVSVTTQPLPPVTPPPSPPGEEHVPTPAQHKDPGPAANYAEQLTIQQLPRSPQKVKKKLDC